MDLVFTKTTPWYEQPGVLIPSTIALSLFVMCVVLILFFVSLYLCYYCFCHKPRPRRDVEPTATINDLTPLLQNRPSGEETADTDQILEAKDFLKYLPYKLERPIFFVGRKHKEYYLLKHASKWFVMCQLTPFQSKNAINSRKVSRHSVHSQGEKNAIKYFLKEISKKSNFVCPIVEAEYNLLKKRLTIIREFYKHGSLYDFVKSTKPLTTHENKQARAGHEIVEKCVRTFGKCILGGLMYLKMNGFCFPNLSPSNIMIHKVDGEFVCKLCDIENSIMGIVHQDQKFLNSQQSSREGPVDQEIVSFGKILYFMSTGKESVRKAIKEKFKEIESDQLKMILRLIFVEKSSVDVKNLLDDPYFSGVVDVDVEPKVLKFPKVHNKDIRKILKKTKDVYNYK